MEKLEILKDRFPIFTNDLQYLYVHSLIDSGCASKAFMVLNDIDSTNTKREINAFKSQSLMKMGRHEEAIAFADKVCQNGDIYSAIVENVMANIESDKENWQKAIRHYRISSELWRINGQTERMIEDLSSIARLLCRQGREPYEAFAEALVHCSETGGLISGHVYLKYANALEESECLHQAREVASKSLAIYKRVEHIESIAYCLNTLGVIEHRMESFRTARQYYSEAISLLDGTGNIRLLGVITANLSEIDGDIDRFEASFTLLSGSGQRLLAEENYRRLMPNSFTRH